MAAKKGKALADRRAEKQLRYKNRVPEQPDGQPRGKHLAGFKGMKADGTCMCGGCHPNAKAAKANH